MKTEEATLPMVSIITINYNQAEVTRDFLESARLLTYPAFEIIVVDNGSAQDPREVLQMEQYPYARLIMAGRNTGFSGGNNIGIREAKGAFFFIVNNDTVLNADLLGLLIAPLLADPTVGVTCPKIKYYDRPELLQYAGFGPMSYYTGRSLVRGGKQPDKGQYDGMAGPTFFAHGCAMMVRREALEAAGLFAEVFFLYYEELDLSQRIRDAGYSIFFEPKAYILHKESVSVGKASPLKTYYMFRNRILLVRRHGSGAERAAFALYLAALILPKTVLSFLAGRKWEHLKALWKALSWHLTSEKVMRNRSEIF